MKLRDVLEKNKVLPFGKKAQIKVIPDLLSFLEKEKLIDHGAVNAVHDFTGLLNLLVKKNIITNKFGIDGF